MHFLDVTLLQSYVGLFRKDVALKLFQTSESFRNGAFVFNMSYEIVSKDSIIRSGEQALVCLYKGSPGQGINNMRLSSESSKAFNVY